MLHIDSERVDVDARRRIDGARICASRVHVRVTLQTIRLPRCYPTEPKAWGHVCRLSPHAGLAAQTQ